MKERIKLLLTEERIYLYSLDIAIPVKKDLIQVFIIFAAEITVIIENIKALPQKATPSVCHYVTDRALYLHKIHLELMGFFDNETNNPVLLEALPFIKSRFMTFKEKLFELLRESMRGGILPS